MGGTRVRVQFAGLVVFLAGIARDLQWHATHDTQREFETAAKQVDVHWLLWLGAAMLLATSWLALRHEIHGLARRGYLLTAASAAAYAVVSVWHFVEHANGADPQVAHVLLYTCSGAMVAGVGLVLFATRRPGREATPAAPEPNPSP